MATSYSPSIVTNGLKLALDSGNPATYPGTGNTWTDLLHPFQTFSGGDIGNPSWANNTNNLTICLFLKKTAYSTGYANHPVNKWNSGYNVNASFILYHFENYQGNDADGFFQWYGYTSNNGWSGLAGSYGSYRLSVGETAFIALQYNGSVGGQCWLNGEKLGSLGATGTLGPNTAGYSNTGVYGPEAAGTSQVRQISFYDRTLTDAEIVQNYQALRTRYGI